MFSFPVSRRPRRLQQAAHSKKGLTLAGVSPWAIGRGVIGFQRLRRPAMGGWPQSIAIRLTQGYANCQAQYAINFALIFAKIILKQLTLNLCYDWCKE